MFIFLTDGILMNTLNLFNFTVQWNWSSFNLQGFFAVQTVSQILTEDSESFNWNYYYIMNICKLPRKIQFILQSCKST